MRGTSRRSRELIPTTLGVRAWRALDRSPDEDTVEWATALLSAGSDTPSLRVLAGLGPPLDYFEATRLIDKVLSELGVAQLAAAEAVEAYAVELLGDLLSDRREVFPVLNELTGLCIARTYEDSLYPFYRLHFANIQLRELGRQYYWEGVDESNIVEFARDQARNFLVERGRPV